MLTQETITFGKYNGFTLGYVLKDRSYCKWLIEQEWFENGYPYIFNRIKEYHPHKYFVQQDYLYNTFLSKYIYFRLKPLEEIELPLTEGEKICYKFYLNIINNIKSSILNNIENENNNIYNIKAPTRWLKQFELICGMPRQEFKYFLSSYELPNITTIIENIKKEGGIEYKGAKSFLIAKLKSQKQEKWWEEILKNKYGEDIGIQFKYKNCIFDFINIKENTIYECKLSLKDFSEEQYKKYLLILNKYNIIYLIGYDCIINIKHKIIITTNIDFYKEYLNILRQFNNNIENNIQEISFLDKLIIDFKINYIDKINKIFY